MKISTVTVTMTKELKGVSVVVLCLNSFMRSIGDWNDTFQGYKNWKRVRVRTRVESSNPCGGVESSNPDVSPRSIFFFFCVLSYSFFLFCFVFWTDVSRLSFLFIYLCIYLFIYLFIHLFIYLFVCLFVCLFIYLFIYLFFIHSFIYSFVY